MEKIKVLYIDDEEENLKAFQASFRRIFNIQTCKSGTEGFKILKDHNIEVVIADQKMPTQTGVDFFESILDIHPNPIRILLTAYSDINAVIDAIGTDISMPATSEKVCKKLQKNKKNMEAA